MNIMQPTPWIMAPILIPLGGGLLSFIFYRKGFSISLLASIVGISLRTDGPSLLMLLMTGVTSITITLYAAGYFSFRIASPSKPGRHERQLQFFWPLWMILLGSLNGLFLAGDIFNIYVTLELIGLSAVALSALSAKPSSQIAAFRYLLVSLLGSLSYLLGIAFLYKTYALLDLDMLRLVPPMKGAHTAFALMSVGLMLKTALFPMHFWLPPAHANALAPVSAILSALVVKASFYLLFRFWFDIFNDLVTPGALFVIGLLGTGAVFWGSIQALRQHRMKLLIAYSTVAQLGYLFIAFPLTQIQEKLYWLPVICMAMGHGFAKTAMFMASGAIFLHVKHDRINELTGVRAYLPVTVFAYTIAGVNLMGLPPSGGFIAKWMLIYAAFEMHKWWWGIVIMLGSLLAAAYVYRVVSKLYVMPPDTIIIEKKAHSMLLEWPPLFLAILSLILGILAPYMVSILLLSKKLVSIGGIM